MTLAFTLLGVLTLAGAIAAMSLRNLVHCALCLVVTFGGLAGLFILLGAEFVGLAQVLVYVGAVAILIVFAILLTRGAEPPAQPSLSASWRWGCAVATVTFLVLAVCIGRSSFGQGAAGSSSALSTRRIGEELMTNYVLPLEVVALLLTAALIGAVLIAMREYKGKAG